MLAVGVLAIVILTLMALVAATLRSSSKSSTTGKATAVAESLLEQTLYAVEDSNGGAVATSFWSTEGVWKDSSVDGQVVQGGVPYDYTISLSTVAGLGGGSNRVKKVDVTVQWWGSRASGGDRQGQGKLQTCVTQLVNEIAAPPP